MLRKKITGANGLTIIRSLYRYKAAYRTDDLAGLQPINREQRRSQSLPENFDELLGEAVKRKKESPDFVCRPDHPGSERVRPAGCFEAVDLAEISLQGRLGKKHMKKYAEVRLS